jgi:hypothetical protein
MEMHTKRIVIIMVLLGVLVIPGIAQLSAQDQPKQESILQSMAEALNAGDVETYAGRDGHPRRGAGDFSRS